MPRRILIINPNTSASMTEDIRRSAEAVKLPNTELTYTSPMEGPGIYRNLPRRGPFRDRGSENHRSEAG